MDRSYRTIGYSRYTATVAHLGCTKGGWRCAYELLEASTRSMGSLAYASQPLRQSGTKPTIGGTKAKVTGRPWSSPIGDMLMQVTCGSFQPWSMTVVPSHKISRKTQPKHTYIFGATAFCMLCLELTSTTISLTATLPLAQPHVNERDRMQSMGVLYPGRQQLLPLRNMPGTCTRSCAFAPDSGHQCDKSSEKYSFGLYETAMLASNAILVTARIKQRTSPFRSICHTLLLKWIVGLAMFGDWNRILKANLT